MEKTLGTHQEPGHTSSSFDGGDNPSNRNITLAPDHSGPAAAAVAAKVMKHNPGIAMDWTTEEQSVLEEGLRAFASDTNVIRYAKIAMQLENKTVRDVALRCRWMSRKENSKRKKEGHNLSRKTKDRKEKGTEPSAKSSQLALQANALPHVMPMIPVDFDDGKSSKANGVSAMKLLENNARAFNQIAANFSSLQIEDNISLFCQARDNLQVLLNSLKDEPEAMKKMPPLPDKLNEEMINSILHPPARPAPRQP